MPRRFQSNRFELDDSNRYDDVFSDDFDDEEEIDPDVRQVFEESQEQDYGTNQWLEKVSKYNGRKPRLVGSDLAADWEDADDGEENPTPDQDTVEEEDEAVGITYRYNKPLRTAEKLEQRDRHSWELNPRSSPDYRKRMHAKFNAQMQPRRSTGKTTPEKMDRRNNPRKQVRTQKENRRTNKSKNLTQAKSR